jgi:endonuclease IV
MSSDCCCNQSSPLILTKSRDHRYGCHVPLKSTLLETLKQMEECSCTQMYRTITENDKSDVLEYCAKHDKSFYVHSSLVCNLAKDPGEPSVVKSMGTLTAELSQIRGLPASCVLHIGKGCGIDSSRALRNVVDRINYLDVTNNLIRGSGRTPFPLLLELAAGQGTELGRTWDQLRHLFEKMDKSKVGLCVDTQHIFASGMCDLQSHESVVRMFDNADEVCERGISLIHLNDSAKFFGSNVDRHASLGEGFIWKRSEQKDGLKSLIDISFEKSIDLIGETGTPHEDSILINSLLKE